MHIEYYPVSGDAVPVAFQRASGGARGHRTQARLLDVGAERSQSRPLNDCARPESGRGHFLFHAVTSPATGCVCLGICESFFCVTGGHGDPQRLCGWLHANIAPVSRRPAGATRPGSTPGSRSIFCRFVAKSYPVRGGRGGGEPATLQRRGCVVADEWPRVARTDAAAPTYTARPQPSLTLLLPFPAAGARRCGPGVGGAQLLPVLP